MQKRHTFGRLKAVAQPPDLIEIQTKSYKDFLQADVAPAQREEKGLQAVFHEIFPIESSDGKYTLDFVKYEFKAPKQTALECLAEGNGTYSAPLYATFRLKDGAEVREEDVYLGEIPLMTEDGAFVVNGAERVVVSQLHRSPGVCAERAVHTNGQNLFSVRIIPDRGTWLEIQFDTNDIMWIHMDRRRRSRKFHATTFLRAIGIGDDTTGRGTDLALFKQFYSFKTIKTNRPPKAAELENLIFKDDVFDMNRVFTSKDAKDDAKAEEEKQKALLARRYEAVTAPLLKAIAAAGMDSVETIDLSFDGGIFFKTVVADPTRKEEDALKDIYHRLRPGDPASPSNAKQVITHLFFDPRRYDLGLVGRYKINQKLGLEGRVDPKLRTLDESGIDVIEAIRHLLDIRCGRAQVDDIDHLGSRRIRTAGELLENQCRVGLARTERLIRERYTLFDPATGTLQPSRLVNSKSLSAVVNDFFGRSQLSQFMDQNNPLSGLAHKRRLSALGPGGLSRERAGMDVRDVHPSHYGRICPIETPEGPNIGLISSLGIYARINPYGFIETPYRLVKNGKVTDTVEYMTADQEENYVIAQANCPLNPDGSFATPTVTARYKTEFVEIEASRAQYMDVSPMQVISIAAGLIPFLEHDDANRALMGANMMRQGVPLLKTERAYVATGLEARAAQDSCVTVLAEQDGIVAYVSATEVVVTPDGRLPANRNRPNKNMRRYILQKFRRTNADTCFNQKPIVRVGQAVKKGDCLADGPATDQGELALGKNLLVAFMPWNGYNFEDSILVNERVVRDDIFTSVHIQDYEVTARDTKLGPEEITRDIPNIGEDALRNLGPDGVVRIGAEVRPGDILVGKVTPKGETELAPEERLLRAIFGEKAADVRDTSLKVPSGITGVVMDVKVVNAAPQESRKAAAPAPAENAAEADPKAAEEQRKRQIAELEGELTEKLSAHLLNEKIPLDIIDADSGDIIIPAQKKITKTLLAKLAKAWDHYQIPESPKQQQIDEIVDDFRPRFAEIADQSAGEFDDIVSEFGGGVVKQVRVFVAQKKNLSVGDKLAGRHGNKGVVARVLPSCDMPFLPDGRPVDIVLNPLGVPSRMNLGQLFETYLGSACKMLGMYAATPVFDGATEEDIDALLREAHAKQAEIEGEDATWINEDGKSVVYDGRTGDPFAQRVVVGQIYMLKLHHLVTDKIHARATGPYSLVTQQPLGGKAQYGGQRMGEMEVWALEAYGVSFALQELLTVKSDDVGGRTRIYESIVKGENTLEAGVPESFSVLMHELRGLCLDMQLLGDDAKDASAAVN